MRAVISLALAAALAACSPAPAPAADDTQPPAAIGALSDADRASLLAALNLSADAQGRIVNACDERVVPRILTAELGGAAGAAQLVAVDGGPNMPSCYGDGPDLHLMVRDGAAWREVFSDRGGALILLPTRTDGVRDIADGGPGFSFPVLTWNGRTYVRAGRQIADSELGGAEFLP